MKAGELTTALGLVRAAMRLHGHLSFVVTGGGAAYMATALLACAQKASLPNFRKNVVTLFSVVDECFGIHSIEIKSGAPQLKAGFLNQLARMLSMHTDFWDDTGKVLFVAADQRRKLSKFPLQDPHVRHLAGAAGAGANILYEMLVEHMNSGRRTGHLQPRVITARRISGAA